MPKRRYRREKIKNVSIESLKKVSEIKGQDRMTVGLDVGKKEIVVCVGWSDGSFERPWVVQNPSEIGILCDLLSELRDLFDEFQIGLESTGTYGDAVRYHLTNRGFELFLVSGKSVSDYREIFDGVPSQHDGKDAAMISELLRIKKWKAWCYKERPEASEAIRHKVQLSEIYTKEKTGWVNRIESLLSRHWPELASLFTEMRVSVLRALAYYGDPALLAADEDVYMNFCSWSRGKLDRGKINEIIQSARTTVGLPMSNQSREFLKVLTNEALETREKIAVLEKEMRKLAKKDKVMSKYIDPLGLRLICAIWTFAGSPANYGNSGAFLKALGLNLTENSSGNFQSPMSISKRGPSCIRKHAFYWAMRQSQIPGVKRWFLEYKKVGSSRKKKKEASSETRGLKGLVAIMRKGLKGLWYCVRHDLPFDPLKIFPGKPLDERSRKRRVSRKNTALET